MARTDGPRPQKSFRRFDLLPDDELEVAVSRWLEEILRPLADDESETQR